MEGELARRKLTPSMRARGLEKTRPFCGLGIVGGERGWWGCCPTGRVGVSDGVGGWWVKDGKKGGNVTFVVSVSGGGGEAVARISMSRGKKDEEVHGDSGAECMLG